MFNKHDCFRLRKLLPNESIPIGTTGVVLMVFGGLGPDYEVEFPDGNGGNLGTQLTFTISEESMDPLTDDDVKEPSN